MKSFKNKFYPETIKSFYLKSDGRLYIEYMPEKISSFNKKIKIYYRGKVIKGKFNDSTRVGIILEDWDII